MLDRALKKRKKEANKAKESINSDQKEDKITDIKKWSKISQIQPRKIEEKKEEEIEESLLIIEKKNKKVDNEVKQIKSIRKRKSKSMKTDRRHQVILTNKLKFNSLIKDRSLRGWRERRQVIIL